MHFSNVYCTRPLATFADFVLDLVTLICSSCLKAWYVKENIFARILWNKPESFGLIKKLYFTCTHFTLFFLAVFSCLNVRSNIVCRTLNLLHYFSDSSSGWCISINIELIIVCYFPGQKRLILRCMALSFLNRTRCEAFHLAITLACGPRTKFYAIDAWTSLMSGRREVPPHRLLAAVQGNCRQATGTASGYRGLAARLGKLAIWNLDTEG